mmetsp:Transcript_87872/g.107665  ORF Transcript_87872/g.107665 Transcript_87872/m.107665 type:complete len:258 (+) Transcript_87872:51-824(+)
MGNNPNTQRRHTKTIDLHAPKFEVKRKSSSIYECSTVAYPEITDKYLFNDVILHDTLDNYLKENKNNYTCFAIYLRDHYCFENLLFVKDALIYKLTLIKINNIMESKKAKKTKKNNEPKTNNDTKMDDSDDDDIDISFHVETDFEYLTKEYKNIYNKLGSKYLKRKINGKSLTLLHKCATDMFSKIYNEYISEQTELTVNLPFEITMQLDYTMKTLNKLNYINDYIYVLDRALTEIWKLLSNTYIHQYKPYIRNNVK